MIAWLRAFARRRALAEHEPLEQAALSTLRALADRPFNADLPKAGTEAPVLSADPRHATYVSQQIQSIARVGQRMWRANYGQNHLRAGAGGEGLGAFVRLQYSDLQPDGTLGPWVYAFACVPREGTTVVVLDPQLSATPDGRLLITMPTSGVKGRAAWACVLENPLADSEWQVGPFCFLGGGAFVGRPRILGDGLYMTLNVPVNGIKPVPAWQGAKLLRMKFDGNVVGFDHLSTVPYVEPRADTSSFQETSIIRVGESGFRAFFRTRLGQYMSTDPLGDGNWAQPTPMPFRTGKTRYDAARSPSGRVVYAGNGPKARQRVDMAVRLSNDDGETWPEEMLKVFFPSVSTYPSVEFGAYPDGSYNGLIYVGFDHGRGTVKNPKDPDTYLNGLPIAVFREEELAAGTAEPMQLDMVTS